MVQTGLTEPFNLTVGAILIALNTWFERFRNLQNRLYRRFKRFIQLMFMSSNTPVPEVEHVHSKARTPCSRT
jgi:hypothetical protein